MVGSFVRVQVKGLKDVQQYLKRIQRKTPELAMQLTEKMAQIAVKEAKAKVAPLKSGTGALKRSIRYFQKGNGFVVTAGEGLPRPYAYYQEVGFTPHFISRTQFGSKAFGRRMRVSQFFPYMSKGFRKALRNASRELRRTANKIVRG